MLVLYRILTPLPLSLILMAIGFVMQLACSIYLSKPAWKMLPTSVLLAGLAVIILGRDKATPDVLMLCDSVYLLMYAAGNLLGWLTYLLVRMIRIHV